MEYGYPEAVVREFIDDYERDWGVRVPFHDAVLLLSLYDGLCVLLGKYGSDIASFAY